MLAARLYGPRDLRIDRVPRPGSPGPGQALLRITAVGVCGSDLHSYLDGRIGENVITTPLIKSLTVNHIYRVEIGFRCGSQKFVAWFELEAEY